MFVALAPGVCLAGVFPANDSIETGEAPAVPARQSCIGPDVLEVVVGSATVVVSGVFEHLGVLTASFRQFRKLDAESRIPDVLSYLANGRTLNFLASYI